MLKNYRLIALVFVFAASGFGVFAQNNETNNYKDVLLDGKPAKLNLVTGEITYTNGEIAKSRSAKKIKDSVIENRTEIKTNLIKDMVTSSNKTDRKSVLDSIQNTENNSKNSSIAIEENNHLISENSLENNDTSTNVNSIENSELAETAPVSDFHVVVKDENLTLISKRYNTTINELIIANKLQTTVIKPGQSLRVRNFDFSEAEIVWIVSKGDTLYSIAKKNNTTIDEIIDVNGLTSSLIKIGQKLQVNQNSTLSKK